jgi:hypothetical protein
VCNFCRGQRTGNLPDKVRAQVLVNGGHCEGCAGDDLLVGIRLRRRLSVSPIAHEIREEQAVLMPSNVELRECLRQRLSNSRLPSASQGTGCRWKLGAGVCASVRGM